MARVEKGVEKWNTKPKKRNDFNGDRRNVFHRAFLED